MKLALALAAGLRIDYIGEGKALLYNVFLGTFKRR